MTTEPLTREQITAMLSELAGTVCRCGNQKTHRQTFCGRCYYRLPRLLRQRLYQRFGEGYEAAYTEAVDVLGPVTNGGA